jgi:uncharacterized membrane protein YdcZ (DUF606 family)
MIKYLLLSMFAGSLLPLQVGANSVLAKDLNSPVTATVISMCVSLLAGIFLFFVTSESLPVSSALESIPLWAYMGGMASIFLSLKNKSPWASIVPAMDLFNQSCLPFKIS